MSVNCEFWCVIIIIFITHQFLIKKLSNMRNYLTFYMLFIYFIQVFNNVSNLRYTKSQFNSDCSKRHMSPID